MCIRDRTIEGQGIETGDIVQDIRYGTSYTEEQINEALNSVEPLSIVPSVDTIGHGTFMAMVAAGNEVPASNFTGAAPESKLAVVKLKPAKKYLRDFYMVSEDAHAYQENDIMLGIKYLLLMARKYSLPLTCLLYTSRCV